MVLRLSSSARICRLTADWLRCSVSPAWVRLPASATAWKIRSLSQSIASRIGLVLGAAYVVTHARNTINFRDKLPRIGDVRAFSRYRRDIFCRSRISREIRSFAVRSGLYLQACSTVAAALEVA